MSAQCIGLVQGADAPKVSVLLGTMACETWMAPFSILTKPGPACAMLPSNPKTPVGSSLHSIAYLKILVLALTLPDLILQLT